MTAVAVQSEARVIGQPKPGYWMLRLRKGAPETPDTPTQKGIKPCP